MKIAYFDCFAGIAGDMVLGAFLDCGVPLDELKKGLASLPVTGWDIEATPVLKGGIHGLKVRVSHGGHSDDEEFAARRAERQRAERQKAAAPSALDAHHDHSHEYGDALDEGDDHHQHGDSHASEAAHGGFDQHNDLDLFIDPKLLTEDAGQTHGEHGHHHHHAHGDEGHSHDHEHVHSHSHGHDHDHSHDHHHDHEGHAHGDHGHSHEHGRSMAEIRALIEASSLSERVRATALDVFGRIAVVEAELHHSTPDEIHFHEIGGVDSLIDICGAAWCLEYLGVDRVYCSALPYSTGTVECAHGTMPVPAPATLKLLRGAPMVPTGLTGEMITPTGAGILAALAESFGDPPAFTPELVGFGAGTKDWPGRPNLLRITIGELAEAATATPNDGLEWSTLALLETNIDDMNPELWNHVLDRLFAAGAVDAWLTPAQMKKNRPAQTLSVLCDEARRDAVLRIVLRETTSLGIRASTVQRAALPREMTSVETAWGPVRVKVARWREGGVLRAAPELDDVARLARESGAPAGEIYAEAARAWQNVRVQENNNGTNGAPVPSSGRNHGAEERSYGAPPHQGAPAVGAPLVEQTGQQQQ